jgi:hypothetical protein
VSRYDQPMPGRPDASARVRGIGALALALERWRRAVTAERESPRSAGLTGAGASRLIGPAEVGDLVRRLDDTGCAYGRVSAARLEHLTRAYERLEMKLNAVLMAVTGTFLSTLAGLLLYYVRGGSH